MTSSSSAQEGLLVPAEGAGLLQRPPAMLNSINASSSGRDTSHQQGQLGLTQQGHATRRVSAASETEIKLNKKLECYKISLIVLILLCLVIISATAVVVVIFYPRLFCAGNTFRPDKTSKGFVLTAADILQSMDQVIDPCQDFYSYACNGWIQKHPIPKGLASWSVMDQRTEDNLSILKSVLEADETVPLTSEEGPMQNKVSERRNLSEAEAKAQYFYRSCIKASENSKTSLHDIIRDVGGWNLTGSAIDMSQFDMRRKVLAVQKYTTSTLFKWLLFVDFWVRGLIPAYMLNSAKYLWLIWTIILDLHRNPQTDMTKNCSSI